MVYAKLAHLFDSVGRADFHVLLDDFIRAKVDFDLSAVFVYPPGSNALCLYNGVRDSGRAQALNSYPIGAYLLDPLYVDCAKKVQPGLYRMRELAPEGLFEAGCVTNHDVRPCVSMESRSLAEEIGYMIPLAGGLTAAYSLMRSNGSPVFSAEEFASLQEIAPLVLAAVRRHWQDAVWPAGEAVQPHAGLRGEPDGGPDFAFGAFLAGSLSVREQTVVQMMLRGHSSHSIAVVLGIAEGTVKNHRKHIYGKLGIASQQELFSRFISHILGKGH